MEGSIKFISSDESPLLNFNNWETETFSDCLNDIDWAGGVWGQKGRAGPEYFNSIVAQSG